MNKLWMGVGVMAAAVMLTGCDDDDDEFFGAGGVAGIFDEDSFGAESIDFSANNTAVILSNGNTFFIGDSDAPIYFGNTSAPNFNTGATPVGDPESSDSGEVGVSGNYRAYDGWNLAMYPVDSVDEIDELGTASLRNEAVDSESDVCYWEFAGDSEDPPTNAIEEGTSKSSAYSRWTKGRFR